MFQYMGSNPNWSQIRKNTCYILKVSNVSVEKGSMLTSLEVSSLACKCIFYRPEHNSKEGAHKTEF